MARNGEKKTAGDGDADMDFFGTKITVKNAALAKLLSDGAAQDVVVVGKPPREPVDCDVVQLGTPRDGALGDGDVEVRIVKDVSGSDTSGGS
jgi:hypothetical protein